MGMSGSCPAREYKVPEMKNGCFVEHPHGFYLLGEVDGMQFTATQPGRRFYGSEKVYAAQTVANLDGRVLRDPVFARTYTAVLQSSRPDW